MTFWRTKKSLKRPGARKQRAGLSLAEVLVYAIIALLLGTLLVLFLQRTFQYHAYIQDKVKLSEIAGFLVRSFKEDLQKTRPEDIQITDEGATVALPQMEKVKLDQTLKWQDDLVFYSHNDEEQKVYRWVGGHGSTPANNQFKSWPFVQAFVIERDIGSRNVSFKVMMQFKDRRERTHRYQTQGTVEIMGGFPVQ